MSTQMPNLKQLCLLTAVIAWPTLGGAQVPVDESGKTVAEYAPEQATGTEELTTLSGPELEGIVGAIALYPDDLLAIVLPASTYPLQIVQAARFLEDLKSDSSLKPNPDWDDSVVALTNYPEIVQMMSDDLDWTWRLGEAVVAQQPAVIAAIERFRDRAYAAGNLKSDDHQTVAQEDGVIQITPVQEDVIYVPYYEPERVVVYQPRPVYYYYPRPYPVYYYPYPSGHAFNYGYFWGVTSAFSIGWYTDSLHIYHHSYHGHPYYGHSYWNNWWYRRPSIHVHNTYYVSNNRRVTKNRYRDGDRWRPQNRRTVRTSDQRITRTRYFPNQDAASGRTTTTGDAARPARDRELKPKRTDISPVARSDGRGAVAPDDRPSRDVRRAGELSPKGDIEFRDRQATTAPRTTTRPSTQSREPQMRDKEPGLKERPRQQQVRQVESRQPQAKKSEPRQPQVRQSQPRPSSQQRQVQPRPSSQPRQVQPKPTSQQRQVQPKPTSQPRQVQPKPASQPRQSNSNSSQSKSSSKSSNKSSNKNSGSSRPRRDN